MCKSIFLILLIAISLSACDGDIRSENRELKAELTSKNAEINAGISERNRAASIYQACQFIVPVCPDTVLINGGKAIADGYAGGGTIFWITLFIKLVIIIVTFCIAVSFLCIAYIRFILPNKTKLIQARLDIQQAEDIRRNKNVNQINNQEMLDKLTIKIIRQKDKYEKSVKLHKQLLDKIALEKTVLDQIEARKKALGNLAK